MTDMFDAAPIKRRLNQKQFADMVGVSAARICHMVKAGILPLGPDGKFDEEEVQAKYDEFKALSEETPRRGKTGPRPAPKPAEDEAPLLTPDDTPDLYVSKKKREYYLALSAQLEYEELTGLLVRKDDVRREAFDMARKTRDSLLQLPARLMAQLAAESDAHKVREMLDKEIRYALNQLKGSTEEGHASTT